VRRLAKENVSADVLVLGDFALFRAAQSRHHVDGGAEIVDGLELAGDGFEQRAWSATSSGCVAFEPLRTINLRRARHDEKAIDRQHTRIIAATRRRKTHHFIVGNRESALSNRRGADTCYSRRRISGPVAQLGARFHGMEEVVSSNLTRSTKTFLRT
jgi:hypothetical protein